MGGAMVQRTVKFRQRGATGNGIKSVSRTYAISAQGTTVNDTAAPAIYGTWSSSSPAVTEAYPYLWAKEIVVYTDDSSTTRYYCVGGRGANGVDAQDIEWVYVRTTENVQPVIVAESGNGYLSDDYKPLAKVTSGRIKGGSEGNANVNVRCTDDPQGVDSTWKYEWEIKREKGTADANGHRAWVAYSGTMTLHNKYVTSPYFADIDNEMVSVACSYDGKTTVAFDKTIGVKMWHGSTEQALTKLIAAFGGTSASATGSTNSASATSGNIKITVNRSSKTIRIEISNAKEIAQVSDITITIACDGSGDQTLHLYVNGVRPGNPGEKAVIYDLIPSASSVKRNKSNTLTPSSLKCDVQKNTGSSSSRAANTDGTLYYRKNGDITSASDGTSLAINTGSVSLASTDTYVTFAFFDTNGTLRDKERVIIVYDGTDGTNAQYIYLKGSAFNKDSAGTNVAICEIKVNGGSNLATQSRGLCLVTLNRQTLAVVGSPTIYDTYEGTTGRNNLVTKLNNLDTNVFVCLVSYDAIGWSDTLISLLQTFGMSDLPYTSANRYPFLFIGYKNLGKGNGITRMNDMAEPAIPVELGVYVANGALSVKDGEKGAKGDTGRMYYIAGKFPEKAPYTRTEKLCPVVYYSPYWWYLDADEATSSNIPSDSNSSLWKKLENYGVVLTDAIFVKQFAQFGAAIITGDWLISVWGKIYDASGNEVVVSSGSVTEPYYYPSGSSNPAYTYFNSGYPNSSAPGVINFVPNYAVDLKTGKSYMNDAYIKGHIVATSGEFSGKIKAGNTTIVGNLNLTDTSNGMTVFDNDSIPRVNLQPKSITEIATLANDTYSYYPLSKSQSASSYEVTTDEKNFSLSKYETLDIDKFAVTMYSTGNGTKYPTGYYNYLTLIITHPDSTITEINITTTRESSYGSFKNLSSKVRFTAPVAGTYKIKFTVRNSSASSWQSGQTTVYAMVNARYQSAKDTQTYIGKDGFYTHGGANKLIWAGESELQLRYGFNGIRWNNADLARNSAMEVAANIKGSTPNAKPVWMPFYNFVPTFHVGVGTTPYLFTSQYIENISENKYAFKIDPYRDRGICIVESGYMDSNGNQQESWIILPPVTFTDNDGEIASLPVGYQITIINWTSTNIYVVPYSSSNHGAVVVDANRNNNYYCDLNGSMSRDTYIFVGSYAGLGTVWLSMHDTQ